MVTSLIRMGMSGIVLLSHGFDFNMSGIMTSSTAQTMTLPADVRSYLKHRAAYWRLPIEDSTSDLMLLKAVLNAEYPHFEVLGTTNFESMPACYGARWAALADPDCQRCKVQTLCLHKFTFKALPDALQKMPEADDKTMASALETESYAIPFARDFARYAQEGAESAAKSTTPQHVPKARHHSAFSATLPALTPTLRDVAEREAVARNVMGRVAPSSGLQKLKGVGRATRKPKFKRKPLNVSKTGREVYGVHTHAARFMRERERNPKLKLLPPGTILQREWAAKRGGEKITVTVQFAKDHYVYEGKSYATLYDVARTVTGMVSYEEAHRNTPKLTGTWSGMKFFARPLAKVLESESI